ncbi:hypothetical protein H1Q63_26330 [Desmonostoc muscorum CCALA 125]|nr:hypothetical protein [Desmonostoc muscorum CCALA 125]
MEKLDAIAILKPRNKQVRSLLSKTANFRFYWDKLIFISARYWLNFD